MTRVLAGFICALALGACGGGGSGGAVTSGGGTTGGGGTSVTVTGVETPSQVSVVTAVE